MSYTSDANERNRAVLKQILTDNAISRKKIKTGSKQALQVFKSYRFWVIQENPINNYEAHYCEMLSITPKQYYSMYNKIKIL